MKKNVTQNEKACLIALVDAIGLTVETLLPSVGAKNINELTRAQYEMATELIGLELVRFGVGRGTI